MIEIIPAIDLIEGRCVRLTKGDYDSKTVYEGSAADTAKLFEDNGAKSLHLVDLDGAKAGEPQNQRILEEICSRTGLKVEWGGGVRNREHIISILNCGASRIVFGSVAVQKRELVLSWLEEFGEERIVLGADSKDGKIATHGWTKGSGIDLDAFVDIYYKNGLRQVVCTDISRDGTLSGPSWEIYRGLKTKFKDLILTVSGGVASAEDFQKADSLDFERIIVGKAFYEGKISLNELKLCWQRG